MENMKQRFFYDLPVLKISLSNIFSEQNFCPVPAGWHVIIADIKNSTHAVSDGRFNEVNLVAAGCLIVALNIVKNRKIEIPLFFGGDGGTILVPEEILNEVLNALEQHSINARINFGFDMHIGQLSVDDIEKTGHYIKIAKLKIGLGFNKALIIGDGLKYAEQVIKLPAEIIEKTFEKLSEPDLSGLECRWDKVKAPAEENEVICYLIEAVNPKDQLGIYGDVLRKMDELYGPFENRNPITMEKLELLLTYAKFKNEMLVKYGGWRLGYLLLSLFKTLLGRMAIKWNLTISNFNGRRYMAELIANTDTITIDGRINTVITGTAEKRILFTKYLLEQEKNGRLIFGYHISKESIMTCYIEDRQFKHIHFVDGSDGGYTEASKYFKQKSKNIDR